MFCAVKQAALASVAQRAGGGTAECVFVFLCKREGGAEGEKARERAGAKQQTRPGILQMDNHGQYKRGLSHSKVTSPFC